MKNLIIFDLDGTLIDSKPWIIKCFTKVTSEIAPERTPLVQNLLVGPTLEQTAKKLLGKKNLHKVEEFKKKFIMYHDNDVLKETIKYDYSDKILEYLSEKNFIIKIATNKRYYPVSKLISFYAWDKYINHICTSDLSSKDKNVYQFLQKNKYKNIFFVGDTLSDAIVAEQNNLNFIIASYGYGQNEVWRNVNYYGKISSLNELPKILNK